MITENDVMRLLERADPARGGDAAAVVDAAGYLDAIKARSTHVTLIDTEPTPTRPPSRHRRLIMTAAAAAAVVAIVVGALVLAARDGNKPQVPAATSTTVAPVTPAAAGEQTARGFLDAYAAFDPDRAITYLADDADITQMMTSMGTTGVEGTREEFRTLISLLEAQGYKQMLNSCEELNRPAVGTRLRCRFDFHLIRSDEIGLGPFNGSYFDLTVRDGEIVQASTHWGTEEFSPQMWEPFATWVSAAYPDDAAVMYADETQTGAQLTGESILLWEQHSRSYVAFGASAAYVARAEAICTAAHSRVLKEGEPPYYSESWGRILDEALTELRTVPPPEAVRAQFDQAYALVEQFADEMLSGSVNDPTADAIHQLEGLPGMQECTFHGPR